MIIEPLLINEPVGIDKAIQNMQNWLSDEDNLAWLQFAYGRSYTDNDDKPYVYIGGREYIEIFGNDDYDSFCFFSLNNDVNFEPTGNVKKRYEHQADVSIIFFINLKETFEAENFEHRADENAIVDVENAILKYFSESDSWTFKRTIRTPKKVYQKYNWKHEDSTIDDEPYTVFAIEFDLKYDTFIHCN